MDLEKLREFYRDNDTARIVLGYLASYTKNMTESKVLRLKSGLEASGKNISRKEVAAVLMKLEELGCGTYIVGRKGHPSRFVWHVPLTAVGRGAAGEQVDLEEKIEVINEDEDAGAKLIAHKFQLREDFAISLNLPADLTARESERIANFIKTLPFQ